MWTTSCFDANLPVVNLPGCKSMPLTQANILIQDIHAARRRLSVSPLFAVRLTDRTLCVNLALAFLLGESFLPADTGLVCWEPEWRTYAVHEAWQYWSHRVAHLPGMHELWRWEMARMDGRRRRGA